MDRFAVGQSPPVPKEYVVMQSADKVLATEIPWEGFHLAKLISDIELRMIKNFDKKSNETKKNIMDSDGIAYAELFLILLDKLSKDETLQYVLTLIDELLKLDAKHVSIFLSLRKKDDHLPFEPLLRVLNRSSPDWYMNQKACSILTSLMNVDTELSDATPFIFRWFCDQLRKTTPNEIRIAVFPLKTLLLKDTYRILFNKENGLALLETILNNHGRDPKQFQLLYEAIYCIWLMSFNPTVAEKVEQTKVILALTDVLRSAVQIKVIRITLASLKNLLTVGKNNELMMEAGLVKVLTNLQQKRWGDDDLVKDLEELHATLMKEMITLSNFDRYKQEVLSGQLEWSPPHTSERFWRENIEKFEEGNFHLIAELKKLLSSQDPQVLSIACHDIGEFVRVHPRGRRVITDLGVKGEVMACMVFPNMQVQKHAILAVQKMMVENWEYLSK